MPTIQSSEIFCDFTGNVENETTNSRNIVQSNHADPQVFYGNVTIIQNLNVTVRLTITNSRIIQDSGF